MAGDNNYSLGPVPNTARKGVASLTMVMLGLTFFLRKYVDRWFSRYWAIL